LYILSAKTAKPKKAWLEGPSGGPTIIGEYELEFTLANIPSNGEYVFDVNMQMKNENEFIRLKIEKRKVI